MNVQVIDLRKNEDAGPDMLSGRMIVPAYGCYYPPAVKVTDLLDVDFDQRDIGPSGLYLVEIVEAGKVTWRGCRRFQRNPVAGLMVDETGEKQWKKIASARAYGYRVVGYVEKVYRETVDG